MVDDSAEGGDKGGEGPNFVEIEIIDLFPHDHPLLSEEVLPDKQVLVKEMASTLNAIVKNANLESIDRLQVPASAGNGSILGKIHGYVYVYDASNKQTFETLTSLIDTVREIEKSDRRGKKVVTYLPKKLVLGNKKDLLNKRVGQDNFIDKAALGKLEINKHRLVSAMTNSGVQEAFRSLINDIHGDNILHKELIDDDRKREEGGETTASPALINSKAPARDGGFLSMFPFLCYSGREDLDEEEEFEEEEAPVGSDDEAA